MTITGTAGELKCKWQRAAVLSSWSITKGETGLQLTATVVNSNFWASQQPLMFVAKNLSWPIANGSLQITGASLEAMLGPKENADGPASSTA